MQYSLLAALAAQAVLGQRAPNITIPGIGTNATRQAVQPATMGDFRLLGCELAQTGSPQFQRVATADDMSVDYCASKCDSEYFGVSDKACHCGRGLANMSRPLAAPMCNTPCPGNADQICGGTMSMPTAPKVLMRRQAAEEGPEAAEGREGGEGGEDEDGKEGAEDEEGEEGEEGHEGHEDEHSEQGHEGEEGEEEAGPEAAIAAAERQAAEAVEAVEAAGPPVAIFSLYQRFRRSSAGAGASRPHSGSMVRPNMTLHAAPNATALLGAHAPTNATMHANSTLHSNATMSTNGTMSGNGLANLANGTMMANGTAKANGTAAAMELEAEACRHGYSNRTGERVCHEGAAKGGHRDRDREWRADAQTRPYAMTLVNGAVVAGASSLLSAVGLAIALL